jgi:hypothetical protein
VTARLARRRNETGHPLRHWEKFGEAGTYAQIDDGDGSVVRAAAGDQIDGALAAWSCKAP